MFTQCMFEWMYNKLREINKFQSIQSIIFSSTEKQKSLLSFRCIRQVAQGAVRRRSPFCR